MGFDFDTGIAAPGPFGGITDDQLYRDMAADAADIGAPQDQIDAEMARLLITRMNDYKTARRLRGFFCARFRLIAELADRSPASHDRVIEEYWERLAAFQ